MRRLDYNTVELTHKESIMHDFYEGLLDKGYSCTHAFALTRKKFSEMSYTMQEWLSGQR